jgi:uncharacterized protein
VSIQPKLPSLELIQEMHSFPTMFTFKVIGDHHESFTTAVLNLTSQAVGPERTIEHTIKMSSQGNHISISLKVSCHSAQDVHSVYEGLLKVPGIRALF